MTVRKWFYTLAQGRAVRLASRPKDIQKKNSTAGPRPRRLWKNETSLGPGPSPSMALHARFPSQFTVRCHVQKSTSVAV
jgi:hypothetical protein